MPSIVQPPAIDLIKESLGTTQGDIIVRGAGQFERRAIGAALQMLRVNAAANNTEYKTIQGTSRQIIRTNVAGDDLEVVNENKHCSDLYSMVTNPAPITVVVGTPQDCLDIDFGTVSIGDIFLVGVNFQGTFAAGAGRLRTYFHKTLGTAIINFAGPFSDCANSYTSCSSTYVLYASPMSFGVVEVAGTYHMTFQIITYVKNFQIPATLLSITVIPIYKQS